MFKTFSSLRSVRVLTLCSSMLCASSASAEIYLANLELKSGKMATKTVDGFSGYGVDLEFLLWSRLGIVVGGERLSYTSKPQQPANQSLPTLQAESGHAEVIKAGIRLYSNTGTNGFYVGLFGQRQSNEFHVKEPLRDLVLHSSTDEGVLELGYRWYWLRSLVFRVGAQAIANETRHYRLGEESNGVGLSPQIAEELAKEFSTGQGFARERFTVLLDIGVGFAF